MAWAPSRGLNFHQPRPACMRAPPVQGASALHNQNVSRRSLLKLIGTTGGAAMMYQTMEAMGYVGTSDFKGPIKLSGKPKGASVLVLGAGLAGMTAAYRIAQGRLQGAVAGI